MEQTIRRAGVIHVHQRCVAAPPKFADERRDRGRHGRTERPRGQTDEDDRRATCAKRGRRGVGHIPEAVRRRKDARPRRVRHAPALHVVEHVAHRGPRDARFPGDIRARYRPHADRLAQRERAGRPLPSGSAPPYRAAPCVTCERPSPRIFPPGGATGPETNSNLHPVIPDQALNLETRLSYPSVACQIVRIVPARGRYGRIGRSGCCHGCCHEPAPLGVLGVGESSRGARRGARRRPVTGGDRWVTRPLAAAEFVAAASPRMQERRGAPIARRRTRARRPEEARATGRRALACVEDQERMASGSRRPKERS